MSVIELSSFHFAHNPKCDCGIVEAYASKQQAVQATRRYRERCLRHYKKARKLHAPYWIKGHRKSRKQFKPPKKSLDIPKWTAINDPQSHIDPPKYEPLAESINGEMSARQLCQTFYRAGKDFAMELDGFHIFKGEMKAFHHGEYTSVLDPRLWTERLYDFRDRMGRYAGSLLDNVSMAEAPTSPKFSKQFRATRASAIYFWWRICGIIEDFCADCEERKQYGLGVEWEHDSFVNDVLRMKNMVGNMWYALGMVLWDDMQKPEGFRWNVIHVHLNGQSTKLPSLKEYTISQEVFSTIPNTSQLPCLSLDEIPNLYKSHKSMCYNYTTLDVLANVVIINQEAADFFKHSAICLNDFRQEVRGFFSITDGPDALSILESFEELVADVDGPDGLAILECITDLLMVDDNESESLSKLECYADVVAEGESAQLSDSTSCPPAPKSEPACQEHPSCSPTITTIPEFDCLGIHPASALSDEKHPSSSPTMDLIAPESTPEEHPMTSPTMTPSPKLDCAATPRSDEMLRKKTIHPSKNWDFEIPLLRKDDPVEDFINYSLELPSMPTVMMCSFGRKKKVTHQESQERQETQEQRPNQENQEQPPRFVRRIRTSWVQLGVALEALRHLNVREIMRARRERWGGGADDEDDIENGNENENADVDMPEEDGDGEDGDSEGNEWYISKHVHMRSGD